MAHEQTDNSNNDILVDNAEKEAILHYKSLAYRLVDFLWRSAKTPDDTSDREPLMALLKNPKMNINNKSLISLANLLQDETTGKIAQETIKNYSPILWIPNDVLRNSVGQYLKKTDKVVFGTLNFRLFNAFFGRLGLLKLVTNGRETSANLLLTRGTQRNPLESSVLKKDYVTDLGGRTFENISSLQYAFWMGDWYMVDMLLNHLSTEQLIEAQKQINEVKSGCIEYQLYIDIDASVEEKDFAVQHLAPAMLSQENIEVHISLPPENYDYAKGMPIPEGKRRVLVTVKGEQHYDYQPLIKTLKDYLPIYQQWEDSGFNDTNLKAEVIRHWCKIVGLVQRYATAFLAQQYCNPDRSFEHVIFDEQIFNRSLDLYNYVTKQFTSWFLRASGLGVSFGILRGAVVGVCGLGGPSSVAVAVDIAAVERLCKVSPEKMASVLKKHFPGFSHANKPQ